LRGHNVFLYLEGHEVVPYLEELSDVVTPAASHDGSGHPHAEAEDGDASDEDEPEPEEAEDLLVEQVDGQRALERPPLDVVQLPDLEVTQSHLQADRDTEHNTIQYSTTLLSLRREICFLARHLHKNI